ncbi:hypothetical protein DL96DRAFT_62502 [Flagelloscypha sp. PMI_526]|nr:hypothetical protein DL96DRAFT_62502 [Flagelloscypha sp. PMI_526]
MLAALGQRALYRVTDSSPEILSSETVELSSRHLIHLHDITGKCFEIHNPSIAKLSLYNLKDVKLQVNARILSSTIEIANCNDVVIEFVGSSSVPATFQIDPEIVNLTIALPPLSEIDTTSLALIVAPKDQKEGHGLGLAGLAITSEGLRTTLVNDEGILNPVLVAGIAQSGPREQYSIKYSGEGGWNLRGIDKKEGIPSSRG